MGFSKSITELKVPLLRNELAIRLLEKSYRTSIGSGGARKKV